jgi:hypothetical protein
MKKVLFLGLALTFVLSSSAHAAHFKCLSVTPFDTTAVLRVQSASLATGDFVNVLFENESNTTYARSTNGIVIDGTVATYTFDELQPSTRYKAIVFNSAGTYLETIAGCSFATKAMGSSNTTQQNTNTNTNTNTSTNTNANTTTTQATTTQQTTTNNATSNQTTFTPTKVASGSSGASSGFLLSVKLENPLKVGTISDAIKFFMTTIIKIAIPFIVLFFIWSGFKFITARGKPDKITEAKKMFGYTIIGTLLILGAWTITNAIIGTVNSVVN